MDHLKNFRKVSTRLIQTTLCKGEGEKGQGKGEEGQKMTKSTILPFDLRSVLVVKPFGTFYSIYFLFKLLIKISPCLPGPQASLPFLKGGSCSSEAPPSLRPPGDDDDGLPENGHQFLIYLGFDFTQNFKLLHMS